MVRDVREAGEHGGDGADGVSVQAWTASQPADKYEVTDNMLAAVVKRGGVVCARPARLVLGAEGADQTMQEIFAA